jgi:fructose-1,6-bisphosphatase-3
LDENEYDPVEPALAAKMHKAISIIQFKLEGQRIKAHPEYEMEERLLLDKIDLAAGIVRIGDAVYPMRDAHLPTVDPASPYTLTTGERDLMNTLEASFRKSEKLQEHIRFLFSHGAMYTIANGNLLYHGCIPMTAAGDFEQCVFEGKALSGRAYMDYLDARVRRSFFTRDDGGDIMWYLWNGNKSPLFGKARMTTFERLFVEDKATHKENSSPYYKLVNDRVVCEKILREFGLSPETSHILNGHVPVKIKDGENPIKGDGLLFIIDGGISKAYQKQTGIAGYTFIFNSRFMALSEHKPYSPLKEDGTQEFEAPVIRTVEHLKNRMTVKDTDIGSALEQNVRELEALVEAFREGSIKERVVSG